ncbi:unnamed protein product, partial [Brachionus calyciflorus]
MLLNILILFFTFIKIISLNLEKNEIIPRKECKNFLLNVKIKLGSSFDFIDDENDLIKIENFNNFDQIKLNCINKNDLKVKKLSFVPDFSSNIILDKKFNLEFTPKIKFLNVLQICLANIRGFESKFNLFEIKNRLITPKISLSIYFSQLKFQNENCELEKLKEFDSFLIFKSLSEILFGMTVKYSQNTCPFIFKNNHLSKLKINGLADTFVNRNILNFKAINLTEKETLNCTISGLTIHVYKGVLSSNLLDKNIFINLQKLQINGFIDSIDPNFLDFARNFSYFQNLEIKLNNFDITLFNSNRWIEKFGNLNSKIFQFRLKMPSYKYPDSDLCLFKNFPIKNNFKISLETYGLNCTCTLFYLLQNRSSLFCRNFNSLKCNFEIMLEKCSKNQLSNVPKTFFIDENYNYKLMEFIFLCTIPIICLFSLISNSINIYILGFKSDHSIIYKFMLYSSLLNFLFCFIYILHLSNMCIFYTGIFCSSVSPTITNQYFEIIFVEFVGNILKTFSNIMGICISLNRYVLLEKDSYFSKQIIKIGNNRIFKLFVISILFICIVVANLDRILTSIVNDYYFMDTIYDYVEKPVKNTFSNLIDFGTNYEHIKSRSIHEIIYYWSMSMPQIEIAQLVDVPRPAVGQ